MPGAVVTRFRTAQLELDFLQEQLLDQGITVPWPPAPSLNVPNVSRNQWDRAKAAEVAAELARRYPKRASGRR